MLIRHLVHQILASFHAPSLQWAVESGSTHDAGCISLLLAGETAFVVFGLTMTRLCNASWQAFQAQGAVVGMGTSCLLIKSLATLMQDCVQRKVYAMDVLVSGSRKVATDSILRNATRQRATFIHGSSFKNLSDGSKFNIELQPLRWQGEVLERKQAK